LSFKSGLIWAGSNAFRQWLGYVCPDCGTQIPCLWNFSSRLVLALTSPIWLPLLKRNKERWLLQQQKRIAASQLKLLQTHGVEQQAKPTDYNKMGLRYGLFMNFFSAFFMIAQLEAYSLLPWWGLLGAYLVTFIGGLIVWLPAGWFFGFIMKLWMEKHGDKNLHLTMTPHPATGEMESTALLTEKQNLDADKKQNE
jgi:hypothetical protein